MGTREVNVGTDPNRRTLSGPGKSLSGRRDKGPPCSEGATTRTRSARRRGRLLGDRTETWRSTGKCGPAHRRLGRRALPLTTVPTLYDLLQPVAAQSFRRGGRALTRSRRDGHPPSSVRLRYPPERKPQHGAGTRLSATDSMAPRILETKYPRSRANFSVIATRRFTLDHVPGITHPHTWHPLTGGK